jgi:hypothetical protein
MGDASSRGWGRGWPQNNAAKCTTVVSSLSRTAFMVRREVAPILKWLIDEVERRGFLIDHGPRDVNDDWSFNNRPIAGTRIPSNHSWGLAVDINAQDYPQGQRSKRPPQWVIDLFQKYSWHNGVDWSNPDPMHFEFMGTPAEARWLVSALAAHHIEQTPPPVPASADVAQAEAIARVVAATKTIVGLAPNEIGGDGQPHEEIKIMQHLVNVKYGAQLVPPLTVNGVLDARTQVVLIGFKLRWGRSNPSAPACAADTWAALTS